MLFLVHSGLGIAPNIGFQVVKVLCFAPHPRVFARFAATGRTALLNIQRSKSIFVKSMLKKMMLSAKSWIVEPPLITQATK
jgi:hypothetical protein